MTSKKGTKERKEKEYNKENEQVEKLNLLRRLKKEFKGWRRDLKKTLGYYPDSEGIVQLICGTKEERNEILKEKKFLTGENCHFQIGKVQKDDGTIYSDLMLSIGIEYLINHTKEGEKSIIQVFSEVGELLLQGKEEGVYSPQQEKEHIEDMIREKFGRKGKCIEVKIGSEQGKNTEVFDALRSKEKGKRRFGIIPKDEPDIDEYLATTKKEDLSPLPIIQYLAYHANKDETLMKLFYDTKPPAYKNDDELIENYKPGCADADYYGLVEVGLRLTEVLKGVSIQGGVGRQRVYDKIISLILNGEDTIQRNDLFDCGAKEKINKYPALEKLHKIISNRSKETGLNTDFKQLYIELNRPKLDEVEKKVKMGERIINEIRYGALIFATLSMFMTSDVKDKDLKESAIKENLVWLDVARKNRIADTYPYYDSIHKHIQTEDQRQALHETNYPDPESTKFSDYESEQEQILISAYDLSRFNYINHGMVDDGVEKNEIRDLYSDILEGNYRLNETYLSCEDFMKNYIEILSEHYKIEFQEKYSHLGKYREYIENTMKYYDKDVDLSDHKLEEIKIIDEKTNIEKKFSYYMEKDHQIYSLKFVKVYKKGDKEPVILMLARKDYEYPEEFTLEYGKHVAQDLIKNFGKNIGINMQPENN